MNANVTALTLLAGLLFAALALARLGSLAGFVSRPVLRGFAFGLALTIIVRQLPHIAGVPDLGGPVWSVLWGVVHTMPNWNGASLACGLGALMLLAVLRRWPVVPGPLLVMALGIAGARWSGLGAGWPRMAWRSLAPPRWRWPCPPCPVIRRSGCASRRWPCRWC
jgi:MFS superfamily sulfate permease-like transporter